MWRGRGGSGAGRVQSPQPVGPCLPLQAEHDDVHLALLLDHPAHQGEVLPLQHLVAQHLLWVEEVQLLVQVAVHLLQDQPLEPELTPPVLDGVHGGGGGRAAGDQGEGLGHIVHGELHPLPLPVPGLPPGEEGRHLALLLLPLPHEQGVGAGARPGRR